MFGCIKMLKYPLTIYSRTLVRQYAQYNSRLNTEISQTICFKNTRVAPPINVLKLGYTPGMLQLQRNYVKAPPTRRETESTTDGSPIKWITVGIVFAVGAISVLVMKHFKNKKEKTLDTETIRSYGRPALGGDFELLDHNNKLRSNKDFLGKWILIYFGFTNCPDICPEELEKMGNVIDTVNRSEGVPNLQPVFISIDPERDTVEAVKTYISDFHSDMIGLTGTREQVDKASRAFRVYYSEGPKDSDNDYLVDHTVIMYLMDDEGKFCEYFGQNKSAGEISAAINVLMFKSLKEKMDKTE